MLYRDVPNRIAERYSKMTKSEKRIADTLLKDNNELSLTSITEFAEQCKVAESTLFRFCKALGYSGYNDFKLALAKEQGFVQGNLGGGETEVDIRILPEDNVSVTGQKLTATYYAALKQTQELLNPESVEMAAKILHESECVYCLGQGGSLIVAMEAWARFATIARQFETIQDTHLQLMAASLMTDKDTIWFFSYSGSTRDAVDILSQAKKGGARIIVVTRCAKSPATRYADVVLICGSNESPLQVGSILAKVTQLYVIDMVYQEYIKNNKEECEKNRELTSRIVAMRQL